MRKYSTVITGVFIVMAALLGWFLPLADFDLYDEINDGRQMELDIEQINLTYRDDLTMNQKINIANYENVFASAVEIDKGIFVQKEELANILGDFLADFTGYRFDVESDWYAVPKLVNLSNNRGTIVVWEVSIWLNESWEFQCYVDDKTGAILQCAFYGDPSSWDNLIVDYNASENEDAYILLSNRFRTAIYNHYASRIGAKIVTFHMISDTYYDEATGYLLVFKDDKNYTFEFTVTISIPYGRIEPY